MSYTMRKMSTMRLAIYEMLKRTRTYHAPLLAIHDWDVTATEARIAELREQGKRLSLTTFLIKATGELVAADPRLRTRVFHTTWGPRQVTFDETSCNVVVSRDAAEDGEPLLLATVIRDIPSKSVLDIADEIRRLKTAELGSIDEGKRLKKLKNVPHAAIKLHDWRLTSSPDYFIKHFGSYGLSSTIHRGSGMVGGSAPAPGTVFVPSRIDEKPVVVDHEIVIRTMLLFGFVVDHNVTDGLEQIAAATKLRKMVEDPDILLGDL